MDDTKPADPNERIDMQSVYEFYLHSCSQWVALWMGHAIRLAASPSPSPDMSIREVFGWVVNFNWFVTNAPFCEPCPPENQWRTRRGGTGKSHRLIKEFHKWQISIKVCNIKMLLDYYAHIASYSVLFFIVTLWQNWLMKALFVSIAFSEFLWHS